MRPFNNIYLYKCLILPPSLKGWKSLLPYFQYGRAHTHLGPINHRLSHRLGGCPSDMKLI